MIDAVITLDCTLRTDLRARITPLGCWIIVASEIPDDGKLPPTARVLVAGSMSECDGELQRLSRGSCGFALAVFHVAAGKMDGLTLTPRGRSNLLALRWLDLASGGKGGTAKYVAQMIEKQLEPSAVLASGEIPVEVATGDDGRTVDPLTGLKEAH